METYNLKHYLEISYIILQHQVKAKDFVELFKLNYYKFTQDFITLSQMAPYYGIKILLENNELTFEIVDTPLFNEKRGKCISFYHRNKTRKNNNISLVGIIGELILLNNDTLTIDSICENVGCSRSAIRHDLKSTREIIESFEIKVKNQPYRGLVAEGNEFHVRLCLLTFFGFAEKNVVITNLNHIVEINSLDSEMETFVRHQIGNVLTQHHITMSYGYIRKIAQYLLIQKNRVTTGKTLKKLTSKKIPFSTLILSEYFHIAKQMMQTLYNGNVFGENEEAEILSLEILILLFKDVYDSKDDYLFTPFYRLLQEIKESLKTVLQKWSLTDSVQENILSDFAKKLVIKDNFQFLAFRAFHVYGRQMIYDENPLLACLLSDMRSELEETLKTTIRTPFLNEMTYFIENQIFLKKLDYERVRIKVFSGESRQKAQMMADILQANLNMRFVESIHVALEQERDLVLENEVAIYDRSVLSPNYVVIEELSRILERIPQIEQAIRERVKIKSEPIDKENIELFGTFETILQHLCKKKKHLSRYYEIYNSIFVILENNSASKETLYRCAALKEPITMQQQTAQYVLFVQFNSMHANLKLHTEIMRMAVKNEEHFQDFMRMDVTSFVQEHVNYFY